MNNNKTVDDGYVSLKVRLMVFEINWRNRFAQKSLRSQPEWSYRQAFNSTLNALKEEASLEYRTLKKGFK